jgi:CBS domain-containing protein
MQIVELMNTKVQCISSRHTAYDAMEKMVDHRMRCLVVEFADNPSDPRLITARDIVFNVIGQGKDPAKVTLTEIAHRPLLYVEKDTAITEAAQLMQNRNTAQLFVRENDRLVGVVAMLDVMAAMLITRAKGRRVA